MLERLFRRRVLGLLVGLALAGAMVIVGTLIGLPAPYPVVLGVAVYVPIGALAGIDDRFDLDAYLDERGSRGVLVDVAVIAVAGAVAGAIATSVALGWNATGLLLVGVAVFGVFVGGQLVFYARTYAYHRPWRDPGIAEE